MPRVDLGADAELSLKSLVMSGSILMRQNRIKEIVDGVDPQDVVTKSQLDSAIGGITGLELQGTWNANTNTPTLVSGVGTQGHYYVVSVAGNTNLDGETDWNPQDWAIFDGVAWDKIDNTQALVTFIQSLDTNTSVTTEAITDNVVIRTAGAEAMRVDGSQNVLISAILKFGADVELFRDGVNVLATNDAFRLKGSGGVENVLGTAGAPSYTFSADPDTGMYRPVADTLALVAGGNELVRIGATTLGFHAVTPVVQASKVSDPSGGATVDAEARTAINALIDMLEGVGLAASA